MKENRLNPFLIRFLWSFLACLLFGCGHESLLLRLQKAQNLSQQAGLTFQLIDTRSFTLASWQRVTHPGQATHIYIEGDGQAWVTRSLPSINPTPTDPLALRLAVQDPAPNVIYLARPCQYIDFSAQPLCTQKYWTTGRTAPEVIAAYQDVLNLLKKRYQFPGFELIGYSGGAAVAVLVAEHRKDVLSLRTVAGNIHYKAFNDDHAISPLIDSIAPEQAALSLATLPQLHFIGGRDDIVPVSVLKAWRGSSSQTSCVHDYPLPQATHFEGWVDAWPRLLQMPVTCRQL